MPAIVTDNPALVVGFVRAALALAVAFWPNLFNASQQETIIAFVVASLALTAITVKTTVPKTPSAEAPAASIQQPPPAS